MESNDLLSQVHAGFLKDLSPLEATFALKLFALFALVASEKPEKGVRTLLNRAYAHAEKEHCTLAESLDVVYEAAALRTHRRVALLNTCGLKQSPSG
jgi:hypothetical protein